MKKVRYIHVHKIIHKYNLRCELQYNIEYITCHSKLFRTVDVLL